MPLQEASAAQTLAPSELLLLNGEHFATPVPQRSGLLRFVSGGTRLLHLDRAVSSSELLVAAISVALLAAEHNGEVRLTVRKGNNKREQKRRLIIEQGSTTGQWPPGSLEARIGPALARRSFALFKGDTVADLIGLIVDWKFWQTLVINRYAAPYLLDEMVEALVERGIAERIPGDVMLLGIIPYRRARTHVSESGRRAVMRYDLEEVRQLLARCERERPDIWNLLQDQIVQGLADADRDGSV